MQNVYTPVEVDLRGVDHVINPAMGGGDPLDALVSTSSKEMYDLHHGTALTNRLTRLHLYMFKRFGCANHAAGLVFNGCFGVEGPSCTE